MRALFGSLAILLAVGAAAWGQERGLFEKLDQNGDGFISDEEVQGDAKVHFERLLKSHDADKDGKLSRDEFLAGVRGRPQDDRPADARPGDAERPLLDSQAIFQRADKDGDGKISKEEAPERLAAIFDRVDANSDGQIDKEELAKYFAEMRRRLEGEQPSGPAAPMRGEGAVGFMILRALDADKNGELSAEEIAAAPKVLAGFDKNGDGKLDREELLAQLPAAARPGGEDRPVNPLEALRARFREADANGDGKLSKEEVPERLHRIFEEIDANSDGFLEPAEIREFVNKRRPPE